MKLQLVLPIPTSINKLYVNKYSFNPKTRRNEPTGARVLSNEGAKCKKLIQDKTMDQILYQNWDYNWTKTNYVYQDAIIFFGRKGRDDGNIYKLLNDALEKIAYENDSRVLIRTQRIVYDSKNPRLELTITPVDFVGIFDGNEEAKTFEEKCKTCTRYLEGRCSILVDSLDSYVREEIGSIDNPECTKFKLKTTKSKITKK